MTMMVVVVMMMTIMMMIMTIVSVEQRPGWGERVLTMKGGITWWKKWELTIKNKWIKPWKMEFYGI